MKRENVIRAKEIADSLANIEHHLEQLESCNWFNIQVKDCDSNTNFSFTSDELETKMLKLCNRDKLEKRKAQLEAELETL